MSAATTPSNSMDRWQDFRTNTGQSLGELATQSPVLVVFLRHGGCPFCHTVLQKVRDERPQLEKQGLRLVLTHLMSDQDAIELFVPYGLADLPRISDPTAQLYQLLGMKKGTAWQIAGPSTWLRGAYQTLTQGKLPKLGKGDIFQLPGVSLLQGDRIVRSYAAKDSADTPDLEQFACPIA